MLSNRFTTLKERLTCFIAQDWYLNMFEAYVIAKVYIDKKRCKYGYHPMSKWNYPTKFSKPHYMAKTKWRYCLRGCSHQETDLDMKEDSMSGVAYQ